VLLLPRRYFSAVVISKNIALNIFSFGSDFLSQSLNSDNVRGKASLIKLSSTLRVSKLPIGIIKRTIRKITGGVTMATALNLRLRRDRSKLILSGVPSAVKRILGDSQS
jgi:hypothetical protein